eukprot:820048-Rhodomonas_salina.2
MPFPVPLCALVLRWAVLWCAVNIRVLRVSYAAHHTESSEDEIGIMPSRSQELSAIYTGRNARTACCLTRRERPSAIAD